MNNLPIFLHIIFKAHPYLRSSVRFTQVGGYDGVNYYGYGYTQGIKKVDNEISFPQEYRDEIIMILNFCGLRPYKEEYDSSGFGYLYFDEEF
jgi:hypothetical protein